jgi:exopolysaccharide production protein ExoQ
MGAHRIPFMRWEIGMRNEYRAKPGILSLSQERAQRAAAPTVKWVRDGGYWWLMGVMIWVVFYQNLPDSMDGFHKKSGFADPNILDRFIKFSVIGVSCYFIANRWLLARNLGRYLNPGLAAFFVVALMSMLWSIDTTATLLRFVSLAAVLLACFAFGLASWHPRRFEHVVIPPIMLILVPSLMLGAVAPELVKEIGDDISLRDAWHGITRGKNEFGMIASFGLILCTSVWLTRGPRAYWAMAGALASALSLVLSKSNTSMFAAGLGVMTMLLLIKVPFVRDRHTKFVAIFIPAVILIYELAIQNVIPGVDVLFAPIASITGKDTTFSQRTAIWKIIKAHIELSPYVGSGYGAYWVGPVATSPSYVFLSAMWLYPTESHNGYLEVVNDLGFLGLACLLLFIICYVRQALQLLRTDRNQAVLFLALLFQEMVMNMSESDWFSRSDTFMVLALGSVCMSRALLDEELRGVRRPSTAAAKPADRTPSLVAPPRGR